MERGSDFHIFIITDNFSCFSRKENMTPAWPSVSSVKCHVKQIKWDWDRDVLWFVRRPHCGFTGAPALSFIGLNRFNLDKVSQATTTTKPHLPSRWSASTDTTTSPTPRSSIQTRRSSFINNDVLVRRDMIKQRVFVNDREVRRVHVSVLYLSRSSVISHLLLLWPGDGHSGPSQEPSILIESVRFQVSTQYIEHQNWVLLLWTVITQDKKNPRWFWFTVLIKWGPGAGDMIAQSKPGLSPLS